MSRPLRAIVLLAAVVLIAALPSATRGQLPCLIGCDSPSSHAAPAGGYSGVRPGSAWTSPLPPFRGVSGCRGPRRPVAGAPAPGARPAAGLAVSLNFLSGKGLCDQLARARRSGARLIRDDLVWADVEPAPGKLRWARYDAIVDRAARYGLTVLPIVDRSPAWAAEAPSALPRDPGTYGAFLSNVVARYGPGGSFWRSRPRLARFAPRFFEVWNEPYFGPFANLRPDPAEYARLVKAAVGAARRANPRARFLVEAETSIWDPDARRDVDWVGDMYRAVPDLGDYADAVAVHPYSSLPPGYRRDEPPVRQQTRRLEELHATLAAHGDGDVPLWITEIGWPTCSKGRTCVSEATQAQDLASAFDLARRRWRYVRALFVYRLDDLRGTGRESAFGLLRLDGSPKPAWDAFRRAAAG
ncbi:MAG TPA: hypothetical protein VGJ32_17430 [Solirubrobacteraceae bacterium]